MIKIFNATDTDFSTAGNVIINPSYCHEVKKKSLNGWYIDVEISIKYREYIKADKLCVVKTKSKFNPQAFRISKNIKYTAKKIKFTAEHVMFDSKKYALLDVRPTNLNGLNGLKYINERTDKTSPFSITNSDVENTNTAYLVRKNLFEAWEIFEERWGGVFDADNWNISFKQKVGNDNGETIAYGKNMQDFEILEDWSNVCTKILPVGPNGLLLKETYLESETQYEVPYTKIVEFQTNLESEEQTEINLLNELKNNAEKYLEEYCIPQVSYTVESNINQKLEIGDTIKVLHPFVNIFTEVLEYEYDLISNKLISLTFGNYKRDVKAKFDNIKNSIETIKQSVSNQELIITEQTNLINSLNKKGYVYIDENEILILDKIPKEEAKNVWRFGLGGIGFSSNGYEGPFETAITMDGKINADFIQAGTMSTARIESLSKFMSDTNTAISTINLQQESIISEVNKKVNETELGTKIEQNYEHVKLAWNQISEFIQMMIYKNKACLAILDGQGNVMTTFNQKGEHFYDSSGNEIGTIGLIEGENSKQIAFAINGVDGTNQMAWGVNYNNNFIPIFYFEGHNTESGTEVGGLFYFESPVIMQGNYLYLGQDEYSGYLLSTTDNGVLIGGNQEDYLLLNDLGIFAQNNLNIYADNLPDCENISRLVGTKYTGQSGNYAVLNVILKDGNGFSFASEITTSDIRLKKNIQNTDANAIDIIKKLKHRKFKWKQNGKEQNIGYIAQELQEIDNNFVYKLPQIQNGKISNEIYNVNMLPLLATATKAIQELQEEIEEQQKTIKKMQQEINELKDREV